MKTLSILIIITLSIPIMNFNITEKYKNLKKKCLEVITKSEILDKKLNFNSKLFFILLMIFSLDESVNDPKGISEKLIRKYTDVRKHREYIGVLNINGNILQQILLNHHKQISSKGSLVYKKNSFPTS